MADKPHTTGKPTDYPVRLAHFIHIHYICHYEYTET